MARRRMDLNRRSNTLEENKSVLSDLRTRNKIEHRSHQELNKLFAKLNSDAASKNTKNSRISSGMMQEKIVTEHTYGPLEGFPVGCWWGIRMDCSRDRVHKPFNKDIEEGPFGAVSLCTSHLTANNDVDLGDSLTFTGGKNESGVQSDDPLIRSYRSQVPLRLVRSYNLTNDYAPKTGYRYDGLYTVAAYWIGVTPEGEENYKFALVRVRNQDPPAWRPAAGFSSKLVHPTKKYSGPRTRCSTERFSTNLCSETHPGAAEHETAGSSRPRTEVAKFSFNKSSVSNGPERTPLEPKKISHDSTIVTRCISSKKIECPSSCASSVSFVESPAQSGNRHLENPSKPPPCKLQNTNISIRTDLYESYLHQDPVKATPMTFCRTFKTARGSSHVVKHSNVGTLNLNSCGPCPRDKEQESQIQSRSGIGKFSSTQSPSSESNRSADRGTPKIGRAVATPTEGKTSFDEQATGVVDAAEDKSVDRPKSVTDDGAKEKRLEQKRRDKENLPKGPTNDVAKSSDEAADETETVCPIMRKSKESVGAASINRDESSEEVAKESHGTMDSLTPDQMLNFIVKQKCHPSAKLLIGSVIGLATGESTILRAYDSLISRQKRWDRSQSLRGTQLNSPTSVQAQSTEPNYECRQGSSGTSRKNERSAPKAISKKRVMKERMLQMRLRRTRVSKRTLGAEKKKSITKPSESMSQRLRKSKATDKSQQPFSKSTVLKKSTKRAKKRGGELARLVIDANIGPKIRGPRNRRLRGRTHIFAKKRHPAGDQDVSTCCGGNSTDVGLKGKKVNARVETLSSRRSKRLSSAAKTRIPQSSRYMERKKNVQENERTPRSRYVERKKRERTTERSYGRQSAAKLEARTANTQTFAQSPSSRGAKRKMPRTRSGSREQASGESSKRSCFRSRNDSTTQGNRMVDAATQCSDRRDAATSVEREIRQADEREAHENAIKVEWIDLDDVKSETHESVGDEHSDFDADEYGSNAIETSREDSEIQTRPKNVLPIRPRATKPQVNVAQRLSAFVPVNLSDSDFRIARLRSIGFRPIEPVVIPEKDPLQVHPDYNTNWAAGSSKDSENPTVVSRIVDEQYNKYTSEETDVVEYMDQELRYQDIEDEEAGAVRKNRGKMSKNGPRIGKNKKIDDGKGGKIDTGKGQTSFSNEDDSEAPWHGWKKSVQNKQAHWIGW